MRPQVPVQRWLLAAGAILYLALSVSVARTKAPWSDEGWDAAPAYNLMAHGSMGTPSLEPTGSWLKGELTGIHEYTYWIMPLHLLAQAGWYRLFGFSLLSLRMLSILCGLVVLASWYVIVARLANNAVVAALACLLLSLDFTFLWSAADGRMDMMCLSLCTAAAAVYLSYRERHLETALLISHSLVAAAIFTHPNGVLGFVALAFLALYYDRRRLRWRHLLIAVPYLLGSAAWALYILQEPRYFLAQFGANASMRSNARFIGFTSPLLALGQELLVRYLAHFGFFDLWMPRLHPITIFVPILYFTSVAVCGLSRTIRSITGVKPILLLTGLSFVSMTLFVGMKMPAYLIYILPLYCSTLAILLYRAFGGSSGAKVLGAAVACTFLSLQLGTLLPLIQKNAYGQSYLPATQFVKGHASGQPAVMGDSTLGFALPYAMFVDDARLGYVSGKRLDLIFVDSSYEKFWKVFATEEPATAQHVTSLLRDEYDLVFEAGRYKVYRRKGVV